MLTLRSPFLHCPIKLPPYPSWSAKPPRILPLPPSCPRISAIDLDRSTAVAITVGVVSVAVGVGIPVLYETQIDNAAKRENTQPCFPCNGFGAQRCRFCLGTGSVAVGLGGDEKEVSRCINCDGGGPLTCTACQGSGIQPRSQRVQGRRLSSAYDFGQIPMTRGMANTVGGNGHLHERT